MTVRPHFWILLIFALASACLEPTLESTSDAEIRLDGSVQDGGSPECDRNEECNDGVFCNGEEACVESRCERGAVVRCDDGIDCTVDTCSNERGRCEHRAPDTDTDGYGAASCSSGGGVALGIDCDDSDGLRFPGALELCDLDGRDEDCNPVTVGTTDNDDDGFIDQTCRNQAPDGAIRRGDDCDDARESVFPGGTEVCNGLDDNCNGMVDEGVGVMVYRDEDRDGHGNPAMPSMQCAGTTGWATLDDDCDDSNVARNGAQPELCDGLDNDCDEILDETPTEVDWYSDADGDGFGADTGDVFRSCLPQVGRSLLNTDCNDAVGGINPGSPELCNAIDDDCDGNANFAIGVNDSEDDDDDGIADRACGPGGADCDDRDEASGRPTDPETCDGRDNDCDGRIDEGAAGQVFYRDLDMDGFGGASSAVVGCMPPPGYVAQGGDCSDSTPARNPNAMEVCNGQDEDCDGAVDNAPASAMCSLTHATSLCVSGSCVILECSSGFGDCNDRATDGCEMDLSTNLSHCGECGFKCEFGPLHATPLCSFGACTVDPSMCEPGWEDCDGSTSNGCETSLFSHNNCGMCGRSCDTFYAQASAFCDGTGGCVFADCHFSWADCDTNLTNGCERPINTLNDCGNCGAPCNLANGPESCGDGTCRLIGCDPGWGNCDGTEDTGCEERVDTATRCGDCTRTCGAGSQCIGDFGGFRCDDIFEIASGERHTCVLREAGGAACWGDNTESQLGGSMLPASYIPVPVVFPPGAIATQISSGALHTCALVADGPGVHVYCWGDNSFGQLGNGTANDSAMPVLTIGITSGVPVQVESGAFHTCALTTSGAIYCWGRNDSGELGRMPTPFELMPQPVMGFPGGVMPSQIALGESFSCARTSGFSSQSGIFCWGKNDNGELGRMGATNEFPFEIPGMPSGFSNSGSIRAIVAGRRHACALNHAGTIACWGDNARGELGFGMAGGPSLPQEATQFAGVTSIGAGDGFTCVKGTANRVWCVGRNDAGQMGNGSLGTNVLIATQPTPGGGGTFLTTPQFLPQGSSLHMCAIENTPRRVLCWGQNVWGQIGNMMTSAAQQTPVPVFGLP